MSNKLSMNNETIVKLSYPLVLTTEKISVDKSSEKNNEKSVNLFTPDLNAKPFTKPERKNKKNDKTDIRDSDIVKTKLKSKKKERSKFRIEEDFDPLNPAKKELLDNNNSALPLARPEAPNKKNSFPVNKKTNTKPSTKKNKKQAATKNKELEKIANQTPENISISDLFLYKI